MLEIIGLMLAGGLIYRTAKRRGGTPWLWIGLMVVGYLVIALVSPALLGEELAPLYLFIGLAWVGLCIAGSFFLTGGMKTAGVSWRCDDCLTFNEPSTLVCACGKRYTES